MTTKKIHWLAGRLRELTCLATALECGCRNADGKPLSRITMEDGNVRLIVDLNRFSRDTRKIVNAYKRKTKR